MVLTNRAISREAVVMTLLRVLLLPNLEVHGT